MEKHILRWSYWLGVISAVVALIWRGINAIVGLHPAGVAIVPGQTVWYMSFYKAALLFLLMAVASANYAWIRAAKQ
jgi:predicted membrane channel-forming protein YqfA (hemolysin III family)